MPNALSPSSSLVAPHHIWLIGASAGIGAALAQNLATTGGRLTLSARNTAALNALQAQLPGDHHQVLPLDVTDTASIAAAWAQISSDRMIPDMLIYNAGIYEPMAATRMDLAQIEQMLDINLRGAFRVLSVALPAFIARDRGHIALVGSVAGYRGLPGAIGYGASKAALIHLAENLRADLAATSIRVQIINPGFVKTRLTDKNDFAMPAMILPEQAAEYIRRGLASGRFEIHFPRRFSYALKLLALLPSWLYFPLLRAISALKS